MGAEGNKEYQSSENGEEDEKYVNEINYEDVPPMPLMAVNHVSRLCKSVKASVDFYVRVLGFVIIERPPSLDFNGAWYMCIYARLRSKLIDPIRVCSYHFYFDLIFFFIIPQ